MPGFDGTGPLGQGPRTGGGRGFCPPVAGPYAYGAPVVYGVGRGGRPRGGGCGRTFGGGRGRGWWYWQAYPVAPAYPPAFQPTKEQEIEGLKEQAEWMQDQLSQINARLNELTAKQPENA